METIQPLHPIITTPLAAGSGRMLRETGLIFIIMMKDLPVSMMRPARNCAPMGIIPALPGRVIRFLFRKVVSITGTRMIISALRRRLLQRMVKLSGRPGMTPLAGP